MIKIIYKITVLVIIIICSCSDKNKNMLVFEKEQNTDIECISISLPTSDILGVSMQLLQIDSILLINDFFGDSLIHVLDVKNKIEHGKMVAKGVGPNEFISPLGIFKTDSNLYIYERQTSRLFSLPIEMVLSQHKNIKLNFTANTQDEHSIINNLFPLSDSMFIASKIDDGIKRFAVYNSKGEKVNEFGEFKAYWDREKDFSNRVRNFFHQTFFEKHPSQKMFVAYSGHILGIYRYESILHAPTLNKELLLSKYSYTFVENESYLSTGRDEGIERGIVTVACSSTYIYIVYNPNKKVDGEETSLPHSIKVIDWNGNPVQILNTGKRVSCLAIDEIEKMGYIISTDPEDKLMSFKLE